MNIATTKGQTKSLSLPNILTYARIAAIPVVIGCVFAQSILDFPLWLRWVALAVFIAAGVTDYLDGYYARMWDQQSAFGRMLDPIADKIMVVAVIAMLVTTRQPGPNPELFSPPIIWGFHIIPALVILLREITVSGLREFLAGLQVSVPVSALAKWKTALQMIALGALILAGAVPQWAWVHQVGLVSLWGAAALTVVTGWDYLRVGLRHMD